jgi:geranylgeranylglycerol-phosphate geranylgeranyltransferase
MIEMKLPAPLRLLRLHNSLLAGVAVIVGGIIVVGGVPGWKLLPAFFAAVFICSGGNAVNDYFDREIDAVNRPTRPIPSGAINPKTAVYISGGLFVAGIGASLFLHPWCIVLAVLNSVMLVVYSAKLKNLGLPGNLTIGYLVGSTFLFGALAMENFSSGQFFSACVMAIMAAFSSVGRELVKGIEDLQGDKSLGIRTFPIVHGVRLAVALAGVFTISAIVLSPLPYICWGFKWPYLLLVVLSSLVFCLGLSVIFTSQSRASASRTSLLYKIAMGIGLLAFLIGAIY